MRVGKNIKQLRENKGMTQLELAERAEISRSMLSQIEHETKNPSLQVGKLIADALGCTMEDLMREDDTEKTKGA